MRFGWREVLIGRTEWTDFDRPEGMRTVNRWRSALCGDQDGGILAGATVCAPIVVVASAPGPAVAQAALRAVIEKQRKRLRRTPFAPSIDRPTRPEKDFGTRVMAWP